MRATGLSLLIALFITPLAAFAQAANPVPPPGTQPDRYQIEVSGLEESASPMNMVVGFQDGAQTMLAVPQNGTFEINAEIAANSHGLINTISNGQDDPNDPSNWFVNNPPGPNLPPGKIPYPVAPLMCIYYWYTWIEIPDLGGNGRSLWVQVIHMAWAPC